MDEEGLIPGKQLIFSPRSYMKKFMGQTPDSGLIKNVLFLRRET